MFAPALDLADPAPVECGEAAFEILNPASGESSVGFELRFTRSTRPDARSASADDSREVRPHSLQPGQCVFHLGQLDLNAGLLCLCPAGEDVEDQFGAVDDGQIDRLFEVAHLPGGQVVVEDDEFGIGRVTDVGDFLGLALADIVSSVDLPPLLRHSPDDFGPGGGGQRRQLVQRIIRGHDGVWQDNFHQHRSLLFGAEFGSRQFFQVVASSLPMNILAAPHTGSRRPHYITPCGSRTDGGRGKGGKACASGEFNDPQVPPLVESDDLQQAHRGGPPGRAEVIRLVRLEPTRIANVF